MRDRDVTSAGSASKEPMATIATPCATSKHGSEDREIEIPVERRLKAVVAEVRTRDGVPCLLEGVSVELAGLDVVVDQQDAEPGRRHRRPRRFFLRDARRDARRDGRRGARSGAPRPCMRHRSRKPPDRATRNPRSARGAAGYRGIRGWGATL